MNRRMSWPAWVVVVAAVAVTIWTTALLASWPPDPSASGAVPITGKAGPPAANPSSPADGTAAGEEQGPALSAVVLGDAFSKGTSQNTGPEWPQLLGESLGWDMAVEARPGSGYVGDGNTPTLGDRLDEALAEPRDVVVLANGVADVNAEPDAVAAAADELLTRLAEEAPDATVVLVSPFSNGDPGPVTTALTERLREVAETHEVVWVDATGFLPFGADLIGEDGIHPTDQGHQRLAEQMRDALVAAEVVEPQD